MIRLGRTAAAVVAWLLLAAGCAAPTPQPTPNPDAPELVGRWQQFIPIESMPADLTLDLSGSGAVDGETARWRLADGDIYIKWGGRETRYSYTVSGYMLTLYDISAGASEFYINPEVFAAGADRNAELKGRWAAWSTFSKLDFDGGGGLTTIVYTTAGRTDLMQKYAARDGILQTADTGGNYTYNLYSFDEDGALLLAETSEYDSENRQWTAYWKLEEAPRDVLGEWSKAVAKEPGDEGLPATLRLEDGNKGSATAGGKAASDIKWEYYSCGFVILEHSETNLQYAWCSQREGVLALGNPDLDEAWYTGPAFRPGGALPEELAGAWKPEEESKLKLVLKANGMAELTDEAGETRLAAAAAAGDLIRLQYEGKNYYMAYYIDNDTMQLYYNEQPFLEKKDLPVILAKN
jgi:hypothetical protein